MKKIDLLELNKLIPKHDCLIIGSPKGVGFSTYISEIIAHYIFFSDNYSILLLTHTRKDNIDLLFKIQKAYNFFGVSLERDGDVLYTKGEEGSGVCVMNYDDFLLQSIESEEGFDLIIIDKDDFSNKLYSHLGLLKEKSKKLLFNTYDLPHGIFYNSDEDRVAITSKYSNENIEKNIGKYPNIINYDRILLGEFND